MATHTNFADRVISSNIQLRHPQRIRLEEFAQKTGSSLSALVRDAVDSWLEVLTAKEAAGELEVTGCKRLEKTPEKITEKAAEKLTEGKNGMPKRVEPKSKSFRRGLTDRLGD